MDANHPEWPAYRRKLEAKLATLTGQLESLLDIHQTNFVRGQLSAIRELISDAEAPPRGAPTPRY